MKSDLRCDRCGAELAGQVVGGQCGNCLLNLALDQTDPTENLTVGIPSVPTEVSRVRYFGDYELLDEIARGGMGVVYRARQASLNRIVALKMILSGDFSSPSVIQRFQAEAEAAARLDHANIVPIYEIGQQEGQQYFSMRFLEGGTLTEAMQGPGFTPKKAAELMIVIARAVHYAHQHGIVHRDLKPGNILLDSAGEPHVADFGLAKLLENDSDLTQSQAVLGTPSYMAPEQASGASKQATTASDVYSLGAILYELLTRQPPFKADTAVHTLQLVLESEPAKLRLLNPAVDRDIETVCLKCLEKDPQSRYASADALAEDLQRWLSHHPILARPVSVPERTFKWARRRPAIASLIVALHLVALAGLVGILWQFRRANNHARTATLEARRANEQALEAGVQSRRAENELWNARFSEARAIRIAGGSGARVQSRALIEKLVERPDLTDLQRLGLREETIAQLALVDIELSTNWISKTNWLPMQWNKDFTRYLQCSDSGRIGLTEYPSHRLIQTFQLPAGGFLDQALMSADEQFLAARYGGGVINVWRVADGELLFDSIHRGPDFGPMSFSPDSRLMMIVADRGIGIRSMDTNQTVRVLNLDRRVARAAFSPDSQLIAVVLQNHAGEIWNADSGEILVHFDLDFYADRIAWHPDGIRLVVSGDHGRLEVRTVSKSPNGELLVGSSRPFLGHSGYIDKLVFAPDGSAFMTYAWDNYSIFWDLVSGRPQLRDSSVHVSQFDNSGNHIITLRDTPQAESVARVLQNTGYKTLASFGKPSEPLGIWFSSDGRLGAVSYFGNVGHAEGESVVWETARNTEVARLKGIWAQFSGDGQTLFMFERAGNRVLSYDVGAQAIATKSDLSNRGKFLYQGLPGEEVNTGQIAPDGRTLVLVATHVILFIDTQGERPVRRWNRSAHVAEISSDGKWLAAMFHNQTPSLWNLYTGRPLFTGSVNNQIKLGGDQWFSVAEHSRVQIYKLDPFEPAHEPIVFRATGSPPAQEFSPDGRIFAMVFDWTTVRLYETATRKHLATLTPPSSGARIAKLTFSADGNWLAAAMNDGVSVGWDLPIIRKELATLGLDWTTAPLDKNEERENTKTKFDLSGLFSSGVRDRSTSRELLDLSAYYNASLDENWHPGTGNSDLAELPHGVHTLSGVPFDLRGLIQVGCSTRGGAPYPREMPGISVNLSCDRLNFLHSAVMAFDMPEGTRVGSYIVHYEDGETTEVPIIFGRDVADWFSQKNENLPALRSAWTGENQASRSAGRTIRLFKSTWENPRRKVPIRHFDFLALHERAAPFLVAVTAQSSARSD